MSMQPVLNKGDAAESDNAPQTEGNNEEIEQVTDDSQPDDSINKLIEDTNTESVSDIETPQDEINKEVEAATKIQASFRGYRTRRELKKNSTIISPEENDVNLEESNENGNEDVSETNEEEKPNESEEQKEGDEEIQDETSLDQAESKDVDNNNTNESEEIKEDESNVVVQDGNQSDDQMNKTLENDTTEDSADKSAAATVIQASFRGYKTRKRLKNDTGDESEEATGDDVVQSDNELADVMETGTDESLNIAATKIQATARGYIDRKRIARSHEAATKIQANFRGYKTRKQLKKSSEDVPPEANE